MVEQQISILRTPGSSSGNLLPLMKAWYWLRAGYRQVRVSGTVTRLLGPQYHRSRDRIEIDITYACNLRCLNCNRSVSQAPEKLQISLGTIKRFVSESIARNKRWKTIRILGGEPTLHPDFLRIIDELLKYRRWQLGCVIEVVSNGHGKAVNSTLKKIPSDVRIENTSKTGNVQPAFGPFNLAPVDDPSFRSADYSNGCAIMEECGMGLTPLGYYPCAVAGGIDRIAGNQLGYADLPSDDDDMAEMNEKLCRLCGHFRDGHCVPQSLRAPLLGQPMSVTWLRLYDNFRENKRALRQGNPTVGSRSSDLEPVA